MENVANTVETTTPEQVTTTPVEQTPQAPTTSGDVAKETPPVQEDRFDKNPRFKELIFQKNEAQRKTQELERRLQEIESRNAPKEHDPFSDLAPEEREQTEKFINKYVSPRIKKEMMAELAPFMHEVQTGKLNKQITEAKELANKVGMNFDEKLPEIVDYLSRPENKGRLTAREALVSLYADEFIDSASRRGKDEVSKETKELMEKKKLANMAVTQVNPNVAIQTDEMALRNMTSRERMEHGIRKAIELSKQGVKSQKVKFD